MKTVGQTSRHISCSTFLLADFHPYALLFKKNFFHFHSLYDAMTAFQEFGKAISQIVLMALLLTDTQFPQFGWVCMGQKRNRESDWKILVLKTMQIRTEYNCNFICFIMPHYPPRPLMSRPMICLVSALRRLVSGGP
jgi:hypothetical protein